MKNLQEINLDQAFKIAFKTGLFLKISEALDFRSGIQLNDLIFAYQRGWIIFDDTKKLIKAYRILVN